ncbi:unnamed protein product, partial [Gordionus sp. m RMFG-2023]
NTDNLPHHIKITLPALSPTMDKGTLAKWEKKEGDPVSEGDLLAEIETDKATVGLEASEEGFVAKILIPNGTKDIPLGKLLCIVVPEKGDIAAFKNFKLSEDDDIPEPINVKLSQDEIYMRGKQEEHKPESSKPPQSIPIQQEEEKDEKIEFQQPPAQYGQSSGLDSKKSSLKSPATPFAKTLAAQKGVALSGIEGTGQEGTITSQDILKQSPLPSHLQSMKSSPGSLKTQSHQSYVDIDLSNMRQTIARRLLYSKQSIPHYYLTMEINMARIDKVRKQFNEILEDDDVKLSINDFIIKASALTCFYHKECNSSWMETQIRQYYNVDVSVAVSTSAGLITPIIFNAESKGLKTINLEMKDLAARARQGKLKPQEFQGGTFTISNLGMFGIDEFTAIINPPQACILSIGTSNKKLIEDSKQDNGFRSVPVMKVTLGCDHRLVDGAVGAKWLQYFKKIMEDPVNMLL